MNWLYCFIEVSKYLLTLMEVNWNGKMKILSTIIGIAFILFIVVTMYLILIQPLLDARKKEKKEK